MKNKYTDQFSNLLANSRRCAMQLHSMHVRPEHILLTMIKDNMDFPVKAMRHMDVDINKMATQLVDTIQNILNRQEQNSMATNASSAANVDFTEQTTSILRLADLEARMNHDNIVDVKHVMLAILHDGINSVAKDIMEDNNMTYDDLLCFCEKEPETSGTPSPENSAGIGDDDDDFVMDEDSREEPYNDSNSGTTQKTATTIKKKTPTLDHFTVDLTLAASNGELDPCVGRENELQRLVEILCRRKKNNPILIGEPGVGKSAIVEGFAQLIANKKTTPALCEKRIVSLDLAGMVAGTKYRGQFEERIKNLISELEEHPEVIVFIDEIHTIIGAGGAPGTMDAANMLKPALARGRVQCIGATTIDEYSRTIEKDGALERRFQKIIVEPSSAEETLQILSNIKPRYEAHHHVRYSDEAIKACVSLAQRYITERAFPDKAIDVLDEVGASSRMQVCEVPEEIITLEKELTEAKAKKLNAVKEQNFELAAAYRDKQKSLEAKLADLKDKWQNGDTSEARIIEVADVEKVVSRISNVPVQRIEENENARLRSMADTLKASIIAQDNAIEKVVKAIQRNRVGLCEPNHPIGVFMFLGPTGVGKTQLAKKLAECMFGSSDALIRIDMSEFTEAFNVSRLVGAPPGYVGYEQGGQLTEQVRRKPYSIVLLDEIEKANANVFNMLLQVLDEGRLTDGNGRLVDFRNTIIIMTSNAGTRQLKEFSRGVGFNAADGLAIAQSEKDKEYARSIIQKSLSKQFAPEFLNRLDEIITFDQLDLNAIKQIIDIELKGLYERIASLGYSLTITDEVKNTIAERGYDAQFGARPLKRAIKNYLEDTICSRILSGEIAPGEEIIIEKI